MQEDLWISNFSRAGEWYYLALVMSPPGRTEAAGSKKCARLLYFLFSVASGRKIIKFILLIFIKQDVQRSATCCGSCSVR
jgi:hypothetical protein